MVWTSAYGKARYQKLKERIKAQVAAYRKANPEKAKKAVNDWFKSEAGKKYKEEAYERYTATFKANAANRRAAMLKRLPSWLTAIDRNLIREHFDIAKAKTMQTGIVHVVDHIVPLRGELVSGLHVPNNLQVLTRDANSAKAHHFDIEE